MTADRMSAAQYSALMQGTVRGRKAPRKPPPLKLPDLPGSVTLASVTERSVQRDIRTKALALLPPGSFALHVPNQRNMHGINNEKAYLGALTGDGMDSGAADLLVLWDATLGPAGNRGLCWIECKRPIRPKGVSHDQLDFMYRNRAIGVVCGWAQCWEHALALLTEAQAPLKQSFHIGLQQDVPDWWAVLGALPALYGDAPGQTTLSTGAILRRTMTI